MKKTFYLLWILFFLITKVSSAQDSIKFYKSKNKSQDQKINLYAQADLLGLHYVSPFIINPIQLLSLFFVSEFNTFSSNIKNRKFVIRAELGSSFSPLFAFAYPKVSIEPRWYWNTKEIRLKNKGYNIIVNPLIDESQTYFSIKGSYLFGRFTILNELYGFEVASIISKIDDEFSIFNGLSIVPNFGLKRIYKSKFIFEFGGGIGLYTDFKVLYPWPQLQLRIGYKIL